ncbi:MAG: Rid family detoxifying hydrolase, partial [Thiotrichaceae bacterium]|nr:Rid family detoxifying hydrolase [Thiotrichaceae bacterium]
QLIVGDVAEQTRQVFKNLSAVLKEAGVSLEQVIKTTVFLQDMNEFAEMNAVYAECFGDHKPARATIEVAKLPLGARVEIEAIASCS